MDITIKESKDGKLISDFISEINNYHHMMEPTIFKHILKSEKKLGIVDWMLNNENYHFFFGYLKNEIVGCIILENRVYPETELTNKQQVIYVFAVIVSSEYRNKGIGTKLLEHSVAYSKNNCYSTIEIETWNNKNMERILDKLNFKSIRQVMQLRI